MRAMLKNKKILNVLKFSTLIAIILLLISFSLIRRKGVIYFAANRHNSILQLLITFGADVNVRDEEGRTALTYISLAPENATVGLINSLIAAGTDVNSRDNEGTTALMFAVKSGPAEAVQALIAAGADVNAKNNYGTTVLLFSLLRPENDCRVLEMLISAGVNVNTPDSFGKTALMWSIKRPPQDSCSVKRLIAAGADINAIDRYGRSVIEMANVYNRADIVAILQENLQSSSH